MDPVLTRWIRLFAGGETSAGHVPATAGSESGGQAGLGTAHMDIHGHTYIIYQSWTKYVQNGVKLTHIEFVSTSLLKFQTYSCPTFLAIALL